MYLHNDYIDLIKVLKKDVLIGCVTICNNQAIGDGVRDLSRLSGALDISADGRLVPDDHARLNDDADDGDATLKGLIT